MRDESGYTLPEVLIVVLMLSFVIAGFAGMLDRSALSAPKEDERAHAIRDAQVGVDRMVHELRQAYAVVTGSSTLIQVNVRNTSGVNHLVEYNCGVAPGKCVRREAAVGGTLTGSGQTVIDRVLNYDQVSGTRVPFTYSSPSGLSPKYVAVHIEVPAAGERAVGFKHKVVLEDGFFIRNLAGN